MTNKYKLSSGMQGIHLLRKREEFVEPRQEIRTLQGEAESRVEQPFQVGHVGFVQLERQLRRKENAIWKFERIIFEND